MKKKKVNIKNKKLEELSSLLVNCSTWAEFNIKMILNGYELDDDCIIVIIHFAFYDQYSWNNWFIKLDDKLEINKIKDNCQEILISACEDEDTIFTEDMIAYVMKKTIFQRPNNCSFSSNKLKRIIIALAKKNPIAVKRTYEQFSTFAKYKV